MNRIRRHFSDYAVGPIENRMDRSVIHQATDDERDARYSVGWRRISQCSGTDQVGRLARAAIPNAQRMSGTQQAMGDAGTHISEAKKGNLHRVIISGIFLG
jgi:hypothetical protein